jgi:hypothetical protein
MSVYASEALECGTLLMVEVALSTAKKGMQIKALVRNRRGFRCGMEFVDLPVAERAEIANYLATVEGVVET